MRLNNPPAALETAGRRPHIQSKHASLASVALFLAFAACGSEVRGLSRETAEAPTRPDNASLHLASDGFPDAPTSSEISYARATARGLYRRRPAERSVDFVPTGDLGGYGLCIRSPTDSGGYDHALVVWPRPLASGALSQVDDDALVLTRGGEPAICRDEGRSYVAL